MMPAIRAGPSPRERRRATIRRSTEALDWVGEWCGRQRRLNRRRVALVDSGAARHKRDPGMVPVGDPLLFHPASTDSQKIVH